MSTLFAPYRQWRVAYELGGENGSAKAPIIFVHGWGVSRACWGAQMHGLEADRQLVAIDLIGHGESDQPETDYSAEFLAGSVLAVMDELRMDRAVLVGHSAGVPVVREFQFLFPDRTTALVLVDGALRDVVPPGMHTAMAERFSGPDYKKSIEELRTLQPPSGELTQRDLDELTDSMLRTPQHVLLGTYEAQLAEGYWKTEKINAPTLAVYAINPRWPMWTDEYEAFVRELIPGVEYHKWEGASHFFIMERAAEFNALLADFLSRKA